MKIKHNGNTTIISGAAFILLGIYLLSKGNPISYPLFAIGLLIDGLGVIGEIKDERKSIAIN